MSKSENNRPSPKKSNGDIRKSNKPEKLSEYSKGKPRGNNPPGNEWPGPRNKGE